MGRRKGEEGEREGEKEKSKRRKRNRREGNEEERKREKKPSLQPNCDKSPKRRKAHLISSNNKKTLHSLVHSMPPRTQPK
jgi:hypothetical protein